MNENINLCEILKGHKDETFYSPMVGNIRLSSIVDNTQFPIHCIREDYNINILFDSKGRWSKIGECLLFPSKDQRDWNKWLEEQKSKVPKTWNKLCEAAQVEEIEVSTDVIFDDNDKMIDMSCAVGVNLKLAKSALALLKIHQLIEVGYGGNVTNEEWNNNIRLKKYIIILFGTSFVVDEKMYTSEKSHIAFHTREQAEEFLSYPENIQLLKDYFMI